MAKTPQRQYSYFLLFKPFGMLSQFTAGGGKRSLKELGPFPHDVYPVGRLDEESEGLLLLTNDNKVKHRLTAPEFKHPRTYLVQVERIPEREALERLARGVIIEGKKTLPAIVRVLTEEPSLPPRPVPIRFRKTVPTSWIEMTLHEGRNRQVRKMTAAVGHPTLRLVRIGIGPLHADGLEPGHHRALTQNEIDTLRKNLKLAFVKETAPARKPGRK